MKKKKKIHPADPLLEELPKNFQHKKFLYCSTHEVTFLEGERCPSCSKRRLITDDWEPSVDTPPGYEEFASFPSSLIAAMSAEKPPKVGILKVVKCQLHGIPYVEGVNKCPFCEFGK